MLPLPSIKRPATVVSVNVVLPAAVDGVISNRSFPATWLPILKFLYPEEPAKTIGAPELPEASPIVILVSAPIDPLTSRV